VGHKMKAGIQSVVANVTKKVDETDVACRHDARDADEEKEQQHEQHDEGAEAER
jgi:hypothetical protein